MSIIWTVSQVERNTDNGVNQVHWYASKTDTVDAVDHSGRSYGSISFAPDTTAAGYISWDVLTKSDVLSWIAASLGSETVASLEAAIESQIAESKAPSILFGYPTNWE